MQSHINYYIFIHFSSHRWFLFRSIWRFSWLLLYVHLNERDRPAHYPIATALDILFEFVIHSIIHLFMNNIQLLIDITSYLKMCFSPLFSSTNSYITGHCDGKGKKPARTNRQAILLTALRFAWDAN